MPRPFAPVVAALSTAGALLLGAAPARAQTSVTLGVELPVVPVMRLTVDRTVISLGQPSEAPYDQAAGQTAPGTATVTVKANRAYVVTMQAARASFLYSGPFATLAGRRDKPVDELRFATAPSCGGGLTPVSVGGATVLTRAGGGSQGGAAGDARTLCFNTRWLYQHDVPGNYSLALTFTVSAP